MLRNLHMLVTYCPYTAQDFWMRCLQGATQDTGITDAAAFVMAIFGATDPALCPGTLQSGISDTANMAKGAAGGGVFTYGGLLQNQQAGACGTSDSTADYVNAIVNGLATLNGS